MIPVSALTQALTLYHDVELSLGNIEALVLMRPKWIYHISTSRAVINHNAKLIRKKRVWRVPNG